MRQLRLRGLMREADCADDVVERRSRLAGKRLGFFRRGTAGEGADLCQRRGEQRASLRVERRIREQVARVRFERRQAFVARIARITSSATMLLVPSQIDPRWASRSSRASGHSSI